MTPSLFRLAACGLAALVVAAPAAGTDQQADEIVVTAARQARPWLETFGNTARIPGERIELLSAQHVHELGTQAPGTWISRGSGQEHLTALRSPVLTGPGACGAFLMLEDGIPLRPTGFCNVNQLFEVPSELAGSTEVLRGPANALYGSNGLHGTLNFLMPVPGGRPGWAGSVESGPDAYYRARLAWDGELGQGQINAGGLVDSYDGWRDSSGYDQQKGFVRWQRGALRAGFSATNLDQDTATFIRGEKAYKDSTLRESNPNPEAFREADSQRAFLAWDISPAQELKTYLRRSDMKFLQHFLPGQPLEKNGQLSGGFLWTARHALLGGTLTAGLDGEIARGELEETQRQDLGPDSNRPTGTHYDYDVWSAMLASYAQLERLLSDRWVLQAGLRVEYLRYDYDNKILDGNTRDDGTACTTGCLFFRPADRTDDFLEATPNVGLLFRIDDASSAWITLTRGFRAPQATELYRLQNGQSVDELDPETIDSLELGWRRSAGPGSLEVSAFAMQKDNYIFRDSDGLNVSDGKTEHLGVEFQADLAFDSGLYASLAGTWAKHTYDFDRSISGGETIRSGDDVDTAPRTLGSARVGYSRGRALAEVEWVHQGDYYLNAANTAEYDGHDIFNFRSRWRFTDDWSLALRVRNLTDKKYADRADFAFGSFRYLPARDREVFVELAYRLL
jgi:outer membrane receptor protein involved in Fe transport